LKATDSILIFSPLDPSLPNNKVKYSTVKCKHFPAVLVYFAKIVRETSGDKYNEFKGVNNPVRARTKVLASFESQRIELALICILMAQ